MHIAVVGGGASARAIARALTDRGATVERFSRSTGFDVLRDNAVDRLAGAQVIVEATGLFTSSSRVATDFFTRSTQAITSAANASGAHHILLSIVNCELPDLQGYGYFVGKTAQERTARARSRNLTVVRSTQWFEFAGQSLARMRLGPLALVPEMKIQPVALDAVAAVIAETATGSRNAATIAVCGPEIRTLWQMTAALTSPRSIRVPLRIPGRTGRAFRDGALLPGESTQVVGPRFDDWIAQHVA